MIAVRRMSRNIRARYLTRANSGIFLLTIAARFIVSKPKIVVRRISRNIRARYLTRANSGIFFLNHNGEIYCFQAHDCCTSRIWSRAAAAPSACNSNENRMFSLPISMSRHGRREYGAVRRQRRACVIVGKTGRFSYLSPCGCARL